MPISASEIEQIIHKFETSEFDEMVLRVGDTHLRVVRRGAGATSDSRIPPQGAESGHAPVPDSRSDSKQGRPAGTAISSEPQAGPGPSQQGERGDTSTGHVVVAPIGGIFYKSPSPTSDPFVARGARVEPGDTVGLIEVMKLFTSVSAGVRGEVEEFLVENGETVIKGTPLLRIREEC